MTQSGVSPIVGCMRLLIKYIRTYPLYAVSVFSVRKLRTRHVVVTWDSLETIEMLTDVAGQYLNRGPPEPKLELYRCTNLFAVKDEGRQSRLWLWRRLRFDNDYGDDANAEDNDVGSAKIMKTGSVFMAL
jgi:hypothetical protein